MIAELFTDILVIVSFSAFLAKRLLTYLHAHQQEEYDDGRFIKWVLAKRVIDKKLTLALFVIGGIWFVAQDLDFLFELLVVCAFAGIAYIEKDPRKDSKKKLAMTARAKRIYFIALGIGALPSLFIFFHHMPWIWIALVQLAPFYLVISNSLLKPFEEMTQKKYWNEAHTKLRELSPTVIGITGSFGKTSVKHILGHILNSVAPTLITPGSVNTPMGIARIMREQLDDSHKYFICEMGAYGPGSIGRLCRLAPPDYGVITAIGHAHYERFKTLEAVAETKYELAEAALKREGKVIVQEKTLRFEHTQNIYQDNILSFVVCGTDPKNALVVESAEQTMNGLEIRLRWDDTTHVLDVPLYGLHHADNAVIAFATACSLGIEPKTVINALKSTPQIPHRLHVKPMNKAIVIDDAFNSNPLGFRSALDLLHLLGKKKRKILITPGMVELGSTHDDVHEKIGIAAAQSCDIAIAIQPKRIQSFIRGFNSEKRAEQTLYEMETFAQAQEWINDNMQDGDVILIENDLPDVYERVPKL